MFKRTQVLLFQKRLTVEHKGIIKCMVQSGVGFWITFQNESLIRLYHVESFSHLQDINIASTVSRTVTMKGKQLTGVYVELVMPQGQFSPIMI